MAIITAPENFKKLERYKEISRRLSQAEGLTDDQARALAKEGKAVIWIDGGLHATEVLGAQQLIETIYQFASKTDEETLRILRDVDHPRRARQSRRHGAGLRLVHAQAEPEAAQHRQPAAALPEVRRPRQQPRLLHDEPAGIHEHQPDSLSRVVPADRLQPSPDRPDRHGDVLAAVPRSVQLRLRPAGRQHARPGRRRHAHALRRRRQARRDDALGRQLLDVVERRPAHHGLLPQPGRPAHREHRQPDAGDRSASCPIACSPRGDLPFPIAPQTWHFRQSIDYSITANYAVLDFAQRYRETLLYNIYVMGRNAHPARAAPTPGRRIRGASPR